MKIALKKLVCLVVFTFCTLTNFSQTAKIDSLSALLPSSKGDKLAHLYLELSKEYAYLDPSKIIYYADLALPIALKNKNHEQECDCYLKLGAGHIFTRNLEKGKEFAQKGIDLAKQLNDEESVLVGMNSLVSYNMSLGNYSEALDLSFRLLQRAQELGLEERVAAIRLNIGSMLSTKGDRVSGLRYLIDALSYYEEHEDRNVESRILNNIAVNFHYRKEYDKSLEYYLKTLEINKELNDIVGQAIVLNNIGEIYKDKGAYSDAIPYYREVIQFADSLEMGDLYKAYGWVGLGEVCLHTGEYRQSDHYLGLALPVFEEVQMQEGVATVNWILAQISLKRDNLSQALRQIQVCKDIATSCRIIELEQQSHLIESEILSKKGDYKGAYLNLKNYSLITDTLYRQERTTSLAQSHSDMEMIQKQNEIELLQRDNQIKDLRIKKQTSNMLILSVGIFSLFAVSMIMFNYDRSRKRANLLLTEKNSKIGLQHQELLRANETKDKFMSIISHDLRNPIGAFKDVIGQLADFPEMFTDELRQQIINELRDETESTYFLLDNLLSWAKSQKKGIHYKPERLNIAAIVKNCIQLSFRAAESKRIQITTEMDEKLEAYADHNMVNLIFRNLVSNAIKFTNENGKVMIGAHEKGDMVVISVGDTGIGIPKRDIATIFDPNTHVSTFGTNHEKGSGLGLVLCKEFVETNGGTIKVESKEGQGSVFTFTLKKYKDTI